VRIEAVPFNHLGAWRVYAMCRLRQQVFVVEQECPYPDLDGRDLEVATRHVLMTTDADELVGYARVLDDDHHWRIGRVVLDVSVRGRGLAEPLMETALQVCVDRDVVLDAQAPLTGWYGSLGFVADGEEFLEDGIPHVPMRRAAL
jgi:ElaA protein